MTGHELQVSLRQGGIYRIASVLWMENMSLSFDETEEVSKTSSSVKVVKFRLTEFQIALVREVQKHDFLYKKGKKDHARRIAKFSEFGNKLLKTDFIKENPKYGEFF